LSSGPVDRTEQQCRAGVRRSSCCLALTPITARPTEQSSEARPPLLAVRDEAPHDGWSAAAAPGLSGSRDVGALAVWFRRAVERGALRIGAENAGELGPHSQSKTERARQVMPADGEFLQLARHVPDAAAAGREKRHVARPEPSAHVLNFDDRYYSESERPSASSRHQLLIHSRPATAISKGLRPGLVSQCTTSRIVHCGERLFSLLLQCRGLVTCRTRRTVRVSNPVMHSAECPAHPPIRTLASIRIKGVKRIRPRHSRTVRQYQFAQVS